MAFNPLKSIKKLFSGFGTTPITLGLGRPALPVEAVEPAKKAPEAPKAGV